MRLFQNAGTYPAYKKQFNQGCQPNLSFAERRQMYLDDRFNAVHLLSPIISGSKDGFFTNGDDEILQKKWAKENGLRTEASLDEILLAQIEAHKTEVFYNLDPMRYPSSFVSRLPGCVKRSICWRAAPSPGADFSAYDLVVCNFPSIIKLWSELGWHSAYMTPSYDPAMNGGLYDHERDIDVLFIGGYSRHHMRRAKVLETVAKLSSCYNVVYCMDRSRLTRLAELPVGSLLGLSRYRRPPAIQKVSNPAVFGLEMYRKMLRSKIVLNGSIDMSGDDRGNMRCFESLGCGALMVSDAGCYPSGFQAGKNMLVYENHSEATSLIQYALSDWSKGSEIAKRGHEMIKTIYSKKAQWEMFLELI